MVRPAIVIGLGGTGQWVLTYLKKDLIETHGKTPDEVRLITFDTAWHKEPDLRRAGSQEEAAQIGNITLEAGEFHHLGGNIEGIAREVAEKHKYPYIGSWLQARTYLRRLPPSQFDLNEGAGKMRPFGRMALFYDLTSPSVSKIWGALTSAMNDLRVFVGANRSLEILIVTSVAGGTGAGMLIDVAHLARQLAEEQVQENFKIRGLVVLPRAFARIPGGDDRQMRARAFASLRELGRFLSVFGDISYPMEVNPDIPDFRKPVKKKLFDLCYLVDPQRERNPLMALDPKYGVFPSIADAISAFLDDAAGQVYVEHVNNLASYITEHHVEGSIAHYSTLGTYTVILPIYYIREACAHRFALEFAEALLCPEMDDKGEPKALSPVRNAEKPNEPGRKLVDLFMTQNESRKGVKNTRLMPEMVNIREKGGVKNERLVLQYAQAPLRWMPVLEPTGETQEVTKLREDVEAMWNTRLIDKVVTSKQYGDHPSEGVFRIEREVQEFKERYIGVLRPDGTIAGGEFRAAIARYGHVHLDRFQKLLREMTLEVLSGLAQSPVEAKGGKLGYLQDFLKALVKELDDFRYFMEEVKVQRGKFGQITAKEKEVSEALKLMREVKDKVISLTNMPRPVAYNAQEKYLQRENELVELRKVELLNDHVLEVTLQMLHYAERAQETIDNWARALVLGDVATEEVGMYRGLVRSQIDLRARFNEEKAIKVRQMETDQAYEDKLYERYSRGQMERLMKGLNWDIPEDEIGKFNLSLTLTIPGEEEEEPERLEFWRKRPREKENASEHNRDLLLSACRHFFHKIPQDEKIAERLENRYTEKRLAEVLLENGSPMITFSQLEAGERLPANFLRVKHQETTETAGGFFRQVVDNMGAETGARGEYLQLVESTDAHKCTSIWTVDLLQAESLVAYQTCAEAYEKFDDDRRLLHCFPAEVNAVKYEQRLPTDLKKAYRRFVPRLVYMLEYEDRVKLFFRCYVYGLVTLGTTTEEGGERNNYYRLLLPAITLRDEKLEEDEIYLTLPVPGTPDIFRAMETFVFRGMDIRATEHRVINVKHIHEALKRTENRVGDFDANIEKIEGFIKEDRPAKWQRSGTQLEQDLGALMHLMLKDEIERFKIAKEAKEAEKARAALSDAGTRKVDEKAVTGDQVPSQPPNEANS